LAFEIFIRAHRVAFRKMTVQMKNLALGAADGGTQVLKFVSLGILITRCFSEALSRHAHSKPVARRCSLAASVANRLLSAWNNTKP